MPFVWTLSFSDPTVPLISSTLNLTTLLAFRKVNSLFFLYLFTRHFNFSNQKKRKMKFEITSYGNQKQILWIMRPSFNPQLYKKKITSKFSILIFRFQFIKSRKFNIQIFRFQLIKVVWSTETNVKFYCSVKKTRWFMKFSILKKAQLITLSNFHYSLQDHRIIEC